MPEKQGKVIVVSGPSGAGKTSVMRRVYNRCGLPLVRCVSATTRSPRPDEVDGVDYHFLTNEEFDQRRQRGDFVEFFRVFGYDHWYGTLWSEVTPGRDAGKWIVLEIDVQGTREVVKRFPDAITIFVRPSSPEELQRRLRDRGTETGEALRRRIERAEHELAMADSYQHQVINDRLDQAVGDICNILTQEWEKSRND
ncbi:MAG: guanylate kinase [Pirellulaceae bacterium]|nr:guanylate kinase [Pirellulaceae bacterium]